MKLDNMTPQQIEEWCNKHSEYAEYKKKCEEARIKLCIQFNMTEEELSKDIIKCFKNGASTASG